MCLWGRALACAEPSRVMSSQERVSALKLEGNNYFKQADFKNAIARFSDAISIMIHDESASISEIEGLTQEDRSMVSVLWANRAMCLLKISPPENEKAIKDCRLALQADPRLPIHFELSQTHNNPE